VLYFHKNYLSNRVNRVKPKKEEDVDAGHEKVYLVWTISVDLLD